jgi:predicted amidohydrolase
LTHVKTVCSLHLFYPKNTCPNALIPKNPNQRVAMSNQTVIIATVQTGRTSQNPGLEANFNLLAHQARQATIARPDLIAFPEYTISGWPYPPEDIINSIAEPIPGNGTWYSRYQTLAQELKTPLLCWLVETENNQLYNTAFILNASGEYVGKYQKVHTNLGEQTWWGWSQGPSFVPIELNGVKYGISICADMWFPETVRCWELVGADIVIHISIADDMSHLIPARAFDSELPIVAAIYNGGSYAVDAQGNLISKLSAHHPGWMAFHLQPFLERTANKYGGQWVPKKGNQNMRNISAYSPLVDPTTRPPWTDIFRDKDGNPQTRDQLQIRFKGRYDANDPTPQ